MCRRAPTRSACSRHSAGRLATIFSRGLLTCLLNPKVYLFMVAVFRPFVRPEYGSLAVQALGFY
jgi:threonine/homoserine/homoserine lactone efflux protein